MDPKQLIVIALAFAALLLIAWVFVRKQRTASLRSRFGAEYDRAVRDSGPQRAESVLLERKSGCRSSRSESFQRRNARAS
jgi:hypothetical protein